jgi:hypothetical protein
LPEDGTCPECGGAYRGDEIVLFGWDAGDSASAANARWGKVVWVTLAGSGYLTLNAILSALSGQWGYAIGYLAAAALPQALLLFRRSSSIEACGAPAQLRLSPRGYGKRDGPGTVTMHPWDAESAFRMEHFQANRRRIVIYQGRKRKEFRFRKTPCEAVVFEFTGNRAASEDVSAKVAEWLSTAKRAGSA